MQIHQLSPDNVKDLEQLKANPTYSMLALAFRLAFEQTAGAGHKGIERHAMNEDGTQLEYDDQPISVFSKSFGNGSLYYQAAKKMEETSRLEPQEAMEEL